MPQFVQVLEHVLHIKKKSRSFDILPALIFCGSELTLLGELPKKQKLGEKREERSKEGSSSAPPNCRGTRTFESQAMASLKSS